MEYDFFFPLMLCRDHNFSKKMFQSSLIKATIFQYKIYQVDLNRQAISISNLTLDFNFKI